MNNFNYKWPDYGDDEIEAVKATLIREHVSYNQCSDEIDLLELRLKEYFNSNFCLLLNSGTSALHVAYLSLGLNIGDEVLVPSYTFPATVMPLLHLGVKIKFLDTESECSPRLSIQDLKNKISNETRLIVVTHMDGIACDMLEVIRIAKTYNCFVVEDCAQAFGTKINGKIVGTFGDIGVFSFQQKKIVSAGEGGCLVTNRRSIYEKSILYSYLQKRSITEVNDDELRKYVMTGFGFNFRMHPLIASLVLIQFEKLEKNIASRKNCMEKLGGLLEKSGYFIIPQLKYKECVYYSFRLILKKDVRDERALELAILRLNALGINIVKSTTKPLHEEQIFKEKNLKKYFPLYKGINNVITSVNLNNCEKYSSSVMRLPPHYNLTEQQIDYIADNIINCFEKYIF